MPDPIEVQIRSYQMGFGDCFLMSVRYRSGRDRHVLIDFGSTKLPPGAGKDHLLRVAENIRERVGEDRLAVVATHRHKDHIAGFATTRTGGPGAVIAALTPALVVQPWTEDPDLAVDAEGPAALAAEPGTRHMMGAVRSLAAMQGVAESYVAEARRNHQYMRSIGQRLKEQIDFIGDDNISNRSAVENLIAMGRAGQAEYLHADKPTGLSDFLGAEVHVLGPPTVEQDARVRKQRARDPGEYWHLAAHAAAAVPGVGGGKVEPLFPAHVVARKAGEFPVDTRWFVRRLREMRGRQMLSIVRTLDKAMNNTSLILLFRIGSKLLLFPGDAQGENWRFALEDVKMAGVRALLAEVDLYKVGHHGSLNATPKSLWAKFARKTSQDDDPERLRTLMSTMADVHGHSADRTEVPRASLVAELEGQSNLQSTEALGPGDLYHLTRISV
ncbi:hypothetical protein SAMN05428974_0529 [Sphingopyxis sp. YR583]|uniref:hypothetical protein n=1 Tax=Sphingopyxis sp. YR583 TaxID=1881047 RepID=UPI0008A7699A|nr:hypothetical protein [Sphingopyxis sp. YR583]SEH12652.1 hypothetical protein SAMN05428974_0529 [Sphingopyxis sp. YR583]